MNEATRCAVKTKDPQLKEEPRLTDWLPSSKLLKKMEEILVKREGCVTEQKWKRNRIRNAQENEEVKTQKRHVPQWINKNNTNKTTRCCTSRRFVHRERLAIWNSGSKARMTRKTKPRKLAKKEKISPWDRWNENLKEAPTLERRLLQGVVFGDVDRALEAMSETTWIQMCLDRGAKDRKGSLGVGRQTVEWWLQSHHCGGRTTWVGLAVCMWTQAHFVFLFPDSFHALFCSSRLQPPSPNQHACLWFSQARVENPSWPFHLVEFWAVAFC